MSNVKKFFTFIGNFQNRARILEKQQIEHNLYWLSALWFEWRALASYFGNTEEIWYNHSLFLLQENIIRIDKKKSISMLRTLVMIKIYVVDL